MELMKRSFEFELLGFLLYNVFLLCMAKESITTINWVLQEANYTRLCSTKSILTINGLFPGPPLHIHKGQRLIVNVQNQGTYNVTLHWHGVKQPRNPWSDGPNYVTQCPIRPGANFSYELIFSTEEGTLWWHAHSDWTRATVHGPIIVHPKHGTSYPFPNPHAEIPIILSSWHKGDVMEVIESALASGGDPNKSDAFTINGLPGDLYKDLFNCSTDGMFKIMVEYGKTYLLRMVNSILNEEMFLMLANHTLTVVGIDGAYVKPIVTDYIMITPGQTMDILITANKTPNQYYMASRAYGETAYDNTTTTAILQYKGNYTVPSTLPFPDLPEFEDIDAVTNFTNQIKALASSEHPIDVPQSIDKRLIITISMNTLPCTESTCTGANRLASSLNNVSFQEPVMDILQAYYRQIGGVFTTDFPSEPAYVFNYTADSVPDNYTTPDTGTMVKVLEYNTSVEIVFQGTNVMGVGENHPMHLHGYSFYVVGMGFGNFDNETDPTGYNLVDPPEMNTVGVPRNGWTAIRFIADNPGVWFMHCHLERHASWGMATVLIVKNGNTTETSMRRPPRHLNPC
ncbi:laccase-14-like [Cornus florida]|uniref:laccase-14-like n=1 Tax=Cornus florida TaxID=4283 RepID=UPI002896376A|nr:laccase-14-like [Cornus florida]